MVALLAPASPAAAELDNCGSGGGNALVYDERAGYGLDTISADINVHTGAVCNSDTSRGNVTYAYTSIDDKFAHYVNAGIDATMEVQTSRRLPTVTLMQPATRIASYTSRV